MGGALALSTWLDSSATLPWAPLALLQLHSQLAETPLTVLHWHLGGNLLQFDANTTMLAKAAEALTLLHGRSEHT